MSESWLFSVAQAAVLHRKLGNTKVISTRRSIMKTYVLALTLAVFSICGIPALAEHDMKSCASECKNCAEVCQKTLDYCLKKGGAHSKPEHVKLMRDCITFCKANQELRSRQSKYSDATSKICADICNDCGTSCEKLKDPAMKDCVDTCKKCSNCCKQ